MCTLDICASDMVQPSEFFPFGERILFGLKITQNSKVSVYAIGRTVPLSSDRCQGWSEGALVFYFAPGKEHRTGKMVADLYG